MSFVRTCIHNHMQSYVLVPQTVKQVYLVYIMCMEQFSSASVIIFTSTCKGCEIISQLLTELEIDNVSLHSQKDQHRRLAALGKFKSSKARVLVATDVASRGLDIPTVELVLNFDVPRTQEDYVHRVGRTARAGRKGCAITLLSQYDIDIFKEIETYLGIRMDEFNLSEDKVLELLNKVTQASQMAKIKMQNFDLTSRKVTKNKDRQEDTRPTKKQKTKKSSNKNSQKQDKSKLKNNTSKTKSKKKEKVG